jgi:hypothetical protein
MVLPLPTLDLLSYFSICSMWRGNLSCATLIHKILSQYIVKRTHLVPLGVQQNIRLINKINLINNFLWSWNSLDDCIKKQWLLHPCVWPRKGGTPKASKSFSNHILKEWCLFWIEVFIKYEHNFNIQSTP